MSNRARFLRAVSHLEPSQVWHRLRLSVRRQVWQRRGPAVAAAYDRRAGSVPSPTFQHPGLRRVAELRVGRRDPAQHLAVAREVLKGRFELMGRAVEFDEGVDWFRPELDSGTRLRKTLLHEFPYAEDLAVATLETGDLRFLLHLESLVDSWEAAAPIGIPGFARDVWNARAVANRLMNWSVAAALLGERLPESLRSTLARLLPVHALFLADNLEWDVRANHLLRDAVGLVFAHELMGCAPEGMDLLRDQVAEQVLEDGCHVERVPLYHAIVLQDLVEVRALLGDGAPDWLTGAVARMAGFLAHLLPGDGRLPLLGDTWHGEVDPGRLLREAGPEQQVPAPEAVARSSGLVVLRRGPVHAVMRAGPHGPDYQLGHAHADLLSFELSVGAERIVTDTGTGLYDAGPERDHLRSTRAHNTLALDGVEQLEAWHSFRVGRRGRARVVQSGSEGEFDWMWASHNAYRGLSGSPAHHRLLAVSEGLVLVLDAVLGQGSHAISSTVHLHPDGGRPITPLGAPAAEGTAPLHERFGETRPMKQLQVEVQATLPWAGGWLVAVDGREDGPAPELEVADGRIRLVQELSKGCLEVLWRPGSAQPGAVRIALCPPGSGSAT